MRIRLEVADQWRFDCVVDGRDVAGRYSALNSTAWHCKGRTSIQPHIALKTAYHEHKMDTSITTW